ncbi:hypothetical protein KUV56_09785 [Ferrimonas balearica]|uniref:hypothetical protein n=1 Tax=Ferrimonas balearica TaxID=44012 RepID=UPI001C575DC0|nr:hypothetical protein [Ferrimonas balearica]MBW3139807.1 hypothetical protein [Ferrimonas balearica]MBY6107087.1 hypothetical protein [Ferrimonas balearica]
MHRLFLSFVALMASASAVAQDSFFPIWGDEAEARGYTLPKPYGLSLSYMDMSNPVTVNSIELTGHPVLEALDINAPEADFDGYNLTLRGDVWIFPFMNVYGILGYTSGDSVATIRGLSCDVDQVSGIGNKLLCGAINEAGGAAIGAPFALEMKGGTYGIGTTLAGGVGNWFALVDMNYTYTSMNIIEGDIKTFVAAPRVGYRWEFEGGRELRVFAGAMYQKVDQYLQGSLLDLGLPPELNDLIGALAPDGEFEVSQQGTSRWNTVVGAQYALSRDWELLIESGFGARRTSFMSVSRRF